MRQKQLYAAPATEVLELRLEANVLQVTSPTYEGNPSRSLPYDGEGVDW